MYSKRLIRGILASAIICTLSINSWAEEEEANKHRMFHIEIKPGHGDAFFAALAEHAAWRREQGDPWTWYVHVVDTGEYAGDCIIRSGGLKWSDMDGYDEFGPKGSSKFWETVGKHVKDSSSWITAHDSRFANWHPDMPSIRLVNVISYELNPNMGEKFAAAVQIYHDAIIEHGYPTYYAFDWSVSGNDDMDIELALFFENWADMAPHEEKLTDFMKRVLGEEKAKEVQETFDTCIKSTKSTIVRYLPELSVLHEQ